MRGMNNVCICAISFELLRIWQDESFLLSQPGFIKPTHVTKANLITFSPGGLIQKYVVNAPVFLFVLLGAE